MSDQNNDKVPTETELDAIMDEILPMRERAYKPKAGEASQSELDEIFKYMGI